MRKLPLYRTSKILGNNVLGITYIFLKVEFPSVETFRSLDQSQNSEGYFKGAITVPDLSAA